jgi:hypothetical protein
MIVALLVTGLVLALLVMAFFVFVIGVLSSVRDACDAYVEQTSWQAQETSGEVSFLPSSEIPGRIGHIRKNF